MRKQGMTCKNFFVQRKKSYFKIKPTETISKPSELWTSLKPSALKFENYFSNINFL